MYSPYLTAVEAAAYLRIHPKTVRKLIADGELQAVKIERHWRIHRGNVNDYITRKIEEQNR